MLQWGWQRGETEDANQKRQPELGPPRPIKPPSMPIPIPASSALISCTEIASLLVRAVTSVAHTKPNSMRAGRRLRIWHFAVIFHSAKRCRSLSPDHAIAEMCGKPLDTRASAI